MADTIRDGKGRGYLAGVNSDNQLITRATAVEQRLHSSIDGAYFEATTGEITLTDAVKTPMIYVKNDNTDQGTVFVIDRVFFDVWGTTGGTGNGTLEYYKNPTITGGTDIIPVNSNFGSGNTMEGTFKKSLTTMVDGGGTQDVHWWWASVSESSSNVVEEGRIVIPAGYSFGIAYTAPAGNTSQKISINIAMYEFEINKIQ